MAAAGTSPTISTFLELRDNMSAGLKNVASEIDRLSEAAKKAEDAIARMKAAQAARPPRATAPPVPPGGARPPSQPTPAGGPAGTDMTGRKLFGIATMANLAAGAISKAADLAIQSMSSFFEKTVSVGKEYEETQLKIASTLYGMGMAPSIETAAAGATKYINILREAAATLPGEAKDYYQVFAISIPDALNASVTDLKKYTEFVSKYTATAVTLSVDAAQAGRDLKQMIQGIAGVDTKTFQELRGYIAMTTKEFNKLSESERFKKIAEAVEKAGGGMGLAADTASAKFGELQSRLDEIFGIGNKPFFEGIKSAVSDINEWLERDKAAILDFARYVSVHLGDAFEGVVGTIAQMTKGIMDFVGASSEEMTIEQKYARREELRQEDFKSPFKLGEYKRLNREIHEYEKTQDRIKKTKMLFEPLDVEFEKRAGGERATPEVKLLMRWRAGYFDQFEKMGYKSAKEAFEGYGEMLGLTKEERFDAWQQLVQRKAVELPSAPAKTREMKVEFNNNRFDIHQQFAEGFDPDRIAVAFASDLARAGEMKVQAAFSPIYGAGQ